MYCEGNDSSYDNETWLEDVTYIVELNGIPIEITKEKPPPQFKQGVRVVVRYLVKGWLSLFKGTVNFGVDTKAKDETLVMADTSLSLPADDKPSSEITTMPAKAVTRSDEILSSVRKKPSPTLPARCKRPRREDDQEERVRRVPLNKQCKAG